MSTMSSAGFRFFSFSEEVHGIGGFLALEFNITWEDDDPAQSTQKSSDTDRIPEGLENGWGGIDDAGLHGIDKDVVDTIPNHGVIGANIFYTNIYSIPDLLVIETRIRHQPLDGCHQRRHQDFIKDRRLFVVEFRDLLIGETNKSPAGSGETTVPTGTADCACGVVGTVPLLPDLPSAGSDDRQL